jgi:hypothetical protein
MSVATTASTTTVIYRFVISWEVNIKRWSHSSIQKQYTYHDPFPIDRLHECNSVAVHTSCATPSRRRCRHRHHDDSDDHDNPNRGHRRHRQHRKPRNMGWCPSSLVRQVGSRHRIGIGPECTTVVATSADVFVEDPFEPPAKTHSSLGCVVTADGVDVGLRHAIVPRACTAHTPRELDLDDAHVE